MSKASGPHTVRIGNGFQALLFTATHLKSLEQASLGIEAIGKSPTDTLFLLRAFLHRFPAHANVLTSELGLERLDVSEAAVSSFAPEPQPEPPRLPENASTDQIERFEIDKELYEIRAQHGRSPVVTEPLRQAMRNAKRLARDRESSQVTVGQLMESVILVEGRARSLLLRVSSPERLGEIATKLGRLPDPSAEEETPLAEMMAHNARELIDTLWPTIRQEVETQMGPASRQFKDEAYERDPAAYEAPIDLYTEMAKSDVIEEKHRYAVKGSALLRAAENEARLRRAPEATLDHLLMALLQDGTETSTFLDGRGVDRSEWRMRLDSELPRFETGPRWPLHTRSLMWSLHDNHRPKHAARPPISELLKLPPKERKEFYRTEPDPRLRFTDLRNLRIVFDEPETIAYRLFSEAGITKEELLAEIDRRSRPTATDEP